MNNTHITDSITQSSFYLNIKTLKYIIETTKDKTPKEFKLYKQLHIISNQEIEDCFVLNLITNETYYLHNNYGFQPDIKRIVKSTDVDIIEKNVKAITEEELYSILAHYNFETKERNGKPIITINENCITPEKHCTLNYCKNKGCINTKTSIFKK